MRIQKYLSHEGICSRREAERLMLEGKVLVNGKVVRELGTQIDPEKDKVTLAGGGAKENEKKITVIIYKPRGIISSKGTTEGETVFDLFPQYKDLNIVGRLDKASEGLLMLTNDGVIAKKVTGEEHSVEKEYEVMVREKINPFKLRFFERGMELEDGITLPAKTEMLSHNSFRIILREGRKHQIRRMCEAQHLTVTRLKRVRIGPIFLGNLKVGASRLLTKGEIAELRA